MEFVKVQDAKLTPEQWMMILKDYRFADQVFESSVYGMFNSGIFDRLREAFPSHFTFTMAPIPESLFKHICGNVEINPKLIESMSLERMAVPINLVTMDDEEPHLMIDGHHRVIKRYMSGLREVPAWIADREMTERINVVKGPLSG